MKRCGACSGMILLALWLGGCAAQPPSTLSLAAPSAKVPLDASYDWHSLLVAPFGTLLKDVPLSLHEVLQFRDEAHQATADEPECYAGAGTPPRFVGHAPTVYLLCFRHDRLSRIEATVRLAQADAPQVFSDACALWLKNTAPTPSPTSDACQGVDGGTAFRAHVENETETMYALLTIRLDSIEH